MNAARLRWGAPPIFDYPGLCRELAGVEVGELSTPAARSVLRRYSEACFTTAKRKKAGERARYPRRRRALMPLRWYAGTFMLEGRVLRLSVTRGRPPLVVRLAREAPYPPDSVRSVSLVVDAGRLCVDVTAEVAAVCSDVDPGRVAGVDPGIIHPYAVVGPDAQALLVSGRALRAEERLHLDDTKARQRRMGRRAPRRGQRGSRRWRKLRASQARAEARHRRRIRQAHHVAAKEVVAWAVQNRVGTLVVGHPAGIAKKASGRIQNRRVATTWRRTHLSAALADKAALMGIRVVKVDERGTSSTCPRCAHRPIKPTGRNFSCPACGFRGHRDLVGAANIAARGGGTTTVASVVTHRRAGLVPARRDRRRALFDARRSCPAPGRPPPGGGSRSPAVRLVASPVAGADRVALEGTAVEDQITWQTLSEGALVGPSVGAF